MRAERLVLILLCAAGAVRAADAPTAPVATTVATKAPAEAPKPAPPKALTPREVELIEFLGEFHDAHGQYVDPFAVEAAADALGANEADAARPPEKKP